MDAHSQRCVFLGYSLSQSAYHCLHLPTGRLYSSRHVQFNEEIFPFQESLKLKLIQPEQQSSPISAPSAAPVPILHSQSLVLNGPPPLDLHHQQPHMTISQAQVLPPNTSSSSSSHSIYEPTAPHNGPQPTAQPSLSSLEPTVLQQNEMQPTTQLESHLTEPHPNQTSPTNPTTTAATQTHSQNATNTSIDPPHNIQKIKTRSKNNITKPNQKLSLTVAGP